MAFVLPITVDYGGSAAITDPGNTMKIAPYSEMFSGLDSAPASGAEIVRWEWDFDDTGSTDGQYDEGMLVGHKFDNAGTYTVGLTVYDDLGGSSSTTKDVVVVAFSGTTYYVANGGSDAADGLTTGTAWATVPYAIANMGGSQGSPNKLLLNRGDMWIVSGGFSAPNPSILGAYGSGASPEIQLPLMDDHLGLGWDESQIWGRQAVVDDLHLNCTIGLRTQNEAITSNVVGTTVRGCTLTNGAWIATHNPSVPPSAHGLMLIMEDCDTTAARAQGFYTQYHSWISIRRCTFIGNSIDDTLTHQMYVNIVEKILVEDSLFDGIGGNGNTGIKESSVVDGLFRRCEITNTKNGISCGTNWSDFTDPSNTNVINDGHKIHVIGGDNQAYGIRLLRIGAVTIRNCEIYDLNLSPAFSTAGIWFSIPTIGTAPPNQVVKILNNTFWDLACPEIDIDTTEVQFDLIEIKNNIFYRTDAVSSDHTFYEISNVAVITDKLDADYNCFYHDLVGQSVISIAVGGSTPSHSYDTWRSVYSQDANSVWGDPLFVSKGTGDLSLTAGSPAIDAGVTLASVHEDINQINRPVNSTYDMGAYEQ